MSPFAGLRVLDLGRVVAAPFATQLLGDMGADIIKVERPVLGDPSREYGPSYLETPDGPVSGLYLSMNRNKRSITIDIGSREGQQLVRNLAVHCDVFIENFKKDDLVGKGLGYEEIAAVNPRIVYCSVTGFGQTGPYAAYPGTDLTFQAMSGLMSVTGEPDQAPQRVGVAFSDLIGGLYAANAIQAALRVRDRESKGQYIDMSLLDCSLAAMNPRLIDYFIMGEVPTRSGNLAPGITPAQLFACKDGLLNVQAGTDRQFHNLCLAVGRGDMLDDPRFRSMRDRVANRAALLPPLEALFASDTVAHWYGRLVAGEVVCSPIYDVAQALDDPQVKAREVMGSMSAANGAQTQFVRNPIRFSGTPIQTYVFPPRVGEHTEAVLQELLGLSDAQIAGLRDRKVT